MPKIGKICFLTMSWRATLFRGVYRGGAMGAQPLPWTSKIYSFPEVFRSQQVLSPLFEKNWAPPGQISEFAPDLEDLEHCKKTTCDKTELVKITLLRHFSLKFAHLSQVCTLNLIQGCIMNHLITSIRLLAEPWASF